MEVWCFKITFSKVWKSFPSKIGLEQQLLLTIEVFFTFVGYLLCLIKDENFLRVAIGMFTFIMKSQTNFEFCI